MKSFYSSKHITNYWLIKLHNSPQGNRESVSNSRYEPTWNQRSHFLVPNTKLTLMGSINISPTKSYCHSAFPSKNGKESWGSGNGECSTKCLSSFLDISFINLSKFLMRFFILKCVFINTIRFRQGIATENQKNTDLWKFSGVQRKFLY